MSLYSKNGYDAMNLAAAELNSISAWLNKNQFAMQSEKFGVLKNLLAANTVFANPAITPPQPYLIREMKLADGSTVRVALIGLTEATDISSTIKITDPIAAAKRLVPELKNRAEIIVALARLPIADVVRLAKEVPAINVILTGTGDMYLPPVRLGETLIAITPYETRLIGELRFYKTTTGKFTVRERYAAMDFMVGEDAETLKGVADAKDATLAAYKAAQQTLSEFNLQAQRRLLFSKPDKSESGTATFVSSQTCASCHAEPYLKWTNSKHARSMDAVVTKKDEFLTGCLQCHASGDQGENQLPRFASVECEACHGPGSLHAAKPAKGYGRVNLKTACAACHTTAINAAFNAATAWLKIKH
ncbi:MAG: multiheme c-type cytochrome [Acidobacteriota bacterium]